MPIPNLPHPFKGLRIIQISDLHLGYSVPIEYLNQAVELVGTLKPELVVVTGDLVNHGHSQFNEPLARLLARIKAKSGVLAALGNHDWGIYSHVKKAETKPDRLSKALAKTDVKLLRNESVALTRDGSKLYIAGLDDIWSGCFDPAAAFDGIPESASCIALSHNPDSFIELLDTPASWVLAGHTHGGQINFPIIGPPYLPIKHKQFRAGHYRLGDKNLYVNRGIGWLKRMRLNARPEITVFTLA